VHYHDWLSNPVMVKNREDNWKMCVDNKDLNKACPKDEEDEEKTAFITSQGIFCYINMPFGPRNAEATYQRLVDKAFHKQIGRNLKVYVDDLVTKSRTEDEIVRDIQETFKTLKEINMKLNPKKCTFGIEEGMFLGYKVSTGGLKPIQQVLSRPEVAGRLQKWSIKLGEYAIHYRPRVSFKGQILADFIVERPEEDSPDTLMKEEEELPEPWILFTDESFCTDGSGAGLILTNPEGGRIHLCPKIQVCSDKVDDVLSLSSPKCLKDVQNSNGKLACLSRFLAKSAAKSLLFFKTLKKCTKKSDFHWTAEAEKAFKQMKQLIAELPMLVAPIEKEELIVYLAAAKETRPKRKQDRFTLLTKTPKENFALEKRKFKAPPSMTTPVEKRNHVKFCEFHGEVGHNTDECFHLKKQIEEMLKAVKLSHLIKELKQNNRKEQPKTTKKGETPRKEKPLAIQMEGMKDLMIIEAEIGGHCIHRMYVDGGSASEILYEHSFNRLCPKIKNQLAPAITPLIGFSGENVRWSLDLKGEERIKVAINPEHPKETVMIGSTLIEEGRNRYITEHRLNVRDGCSSVRQKKQGQAADRIQAIQEEVKKLVEAGIMKEVHYHDWLSNPVMVKNREDNWKMCVDNKDLNKACPKDGYPLVLSRPEVAGRLQKWSIKLGEYAIHYRPRVSFKGQILADFIVERPEEDSPDTLMKEEEELPEPWILFTDESFCTDGSGAGLILTNPEGGRIHLCPKIQLQNVLYQKVPRSENKKADALSKIALTSFADLSKQVLVEELKEKSISTIEVLAVVEEERDTWMTHIFKYLTDGTLPVEIKKARAVRRMSWPFAIINRTLYNNSFFGPWLRFGLLGEIISNNGKQFRDDHSRIGAKNYVSANILLPLSIRKPMDSWNKRAPSCAMGTPHNDKSSNGDTPFSLPYET
nr:reverse transcriptase domain-containing protein [Tanacetum cinerariifolium]